MSEAFNVYMKDVRKTETIKKEEQFKLIKFAQAGDESAKELLIESNLLLVISVAREYLNMGVDLNEMICEGNFGLITAIDKWKPISGASFTSVAKFWIKAAITRNCLFKRNIIRLPENQLIPQNNGTWEGTYYSQCSIDAKDNNGNDLHEIITDGNYDHLVIKEQMSETEKIVHMSLCKLSDIELKIIQLKFGFICTEKYSFIDIAKKLKLSNIEVKSIYEKALKKMRN